MIEVLLTRGAIVIAVLPVIGFYAVEGIAIGFAGIRIDRQPDRQRATLFQSFSVALRVSVFRCHRVCLFGVARTWDRARALSPDIPGSLCLGCLFRLLCH